MTVDNNAARAIQGVHEHLSVAIRGPANGDVTTPGGPATVDTIITGALEHETADMSAVQSRAPAVRAPVARRRTAAAHPGGCVAAAVVLSDCSGAAGREAPDDLLELLGRGDVDVLAVLECLGGVPGGLVEGLAGLVGLRPVRGVRVDGRGLT